MPLEFVDPRPPARMAAVPPAPPAGTASTPSKRAGRPGDTIRVGLLANGFPDSETFLVRLAASLAELAPELDWCRVTKARPPDPLTDEQLAALTACDAVVAAYGH